MTRALRHNTWRHTTWLSAAMAVLILAGCSGVPTMDEADEGDVWSALADHPDDPATMLAAGAMYERQGRPDLARQYYEAVLARRPMVMVEPAPDAPARWATELAAEGLARIGASAGGSSVLDRALNPPKATADQAMAALSGDPEALRFAVLAKLVEDGLVKPAEVEPRRAANLGALLPYSAVAPADGLNRAFPTAGELSTRLKEIVRQYSTGKYANMGTALAEREFLLDRLLPARPTRRAPPARMDAEAAQLGLARVQQLYDLGLVGRVEKEQETRAIEDLQKMLAAMPPPPPPAKPKSKYKGSGVRTGRYNDDKVGGARLPDRNEVAAPAPTAGQPVGVHLLSMAEPAFETRVWNALVAEHPQLMPLGHKAVRADLGQLGTTWRLIAGPLPAADAEKLCQELRAKAQSCTPTGFPP